MSATTCLFFGTFNPVHAGHLIMAQTVLNQCGPELGFDTVTFIPACQPPHRRHEPDMAPARHRVKMTGLATADNPAFQVSDVELHRDGPSYTVDTLDDLRKRHGWETPIPVIIGSDALAGLAGWHRAKELVETVLFLQVERPETPCVDRLTIDGETFALNSRWVEMPPLAISATWVRALMRRHAGNPHALRYVLPHAVIRYIAANGLYVPETAT